MKRILLAIAFLLLPTASYAAGPFDGAYSLTVNNTLIAYSSIHENDNAMVLIILNANGADNATWEAYSGERNGNDVTFTSIFATDRTDLIVNFIDTDSATLTINSCDNCDFPNATVLDLNRVF